MTLFYQNDADVPEGLQTEDFLLRPLTVEDVEPDYAALMASKEMLRCWGGRDWPADDFTLEDNFADLEVHHREHLERQAFTYTVMHPRRPLCLGCIYIDPLERVLALDRAASEAGDFRASVRFWVTEPYLDGGLERDLLRTLISWLDRDWPFEEVFFRANDRDLRQVTLLEEFGFEPRYTVNPQGVRGRYVLFGAPEPGEWR